VPQLICNLNRGLRLAGRARPLHSGFRPVTISDRASEATPVTSDGSVGETNGRSPMLEIANAVVRLYKDAFGRGPTKARAQFAGHDVLVVMLENSLTVAERNLVAMEEHDRLREGRMFYQRMLESELRAIVEQTLGRRTVAFISGIDTRRDVAVEVFTLEPDPQLDPSQRHSVRIEARGQRVSGSTEVTSLSPLKR